MFTKAAELHHGDSLGEVWYSDVVIGVMRRDRPSCPASGTGESEVLQASTTGGMLPKTSRHHESRTTERHSRRSVSEETDYLLGRSVDSRTATSVSSCMLDEIIEV